MPSRRAPNVARLGAIGLATMLVLASCGEGARKSTQGDDGPMVDVVATFYPLVEAARRVGGGRVRVTNLTPPGVEPHDIELTSRDVDAIDDADLLVYLGGGFQPAVVEVATRRDRPSVDVGARLKLQPGDPHFWLDPQLMSTAVQAVADALTNVSPSDAEAFRANARGYRSELAALDRDFELGLSACGRRDLVTTHAAFSYLARRYRLEQLAVAGVSPEAEPDAARLASLTAQIQARHITTVFFEDLVPSKVADTLAREAGVGTAVLSPLEGLTRHDADAGKDYLAIMRDNLAAIRLALGCR